MKSNTVKISRNSHSFARDYGIKKRKKIRILAIDGGGIRGIIPGAILVVLEEKLREKTGNSEAKLTDYFDFIAGTSTGGILSCLYLIPDEKEPSRSKYSAKEALDIYLKRGGSVFQTSLWQKIKTGFGLIKNRYRSRNIDEMLQASYGTMCSLKNAAKPCLVVSYDLLKEKTHLFTRASARENPNNNFKLWEVARATSAAPSYFAPGKIKAAGGRDHVFIDGGIIANNPSLCALSEVKKRNFSQVKKWTGSSKVSSEDIVVVSLGTGSKNSEITPTKFNDKGLLGWIKPILSVRMLGCSSLTADHVERELSHGKEQQYFRIDPQLFEASAEMDNASAENMALLNEAGKQNAVLYDKLLEQITETLIANDHRTDYTVVSMTEGKEHPVRRAG